MDKDSYKKGLIKGFEKGAKTVLDIIVEFNRTSMERIDKVIDDNAKGKTCFDRIATDRERECFIMGWSVCGIQLSALVLKNSRQLKEELDETVPNIKRPG